MFKLTLSVSKTQPKTKTEGLTITEFNQKELDIEVNSDLKGLFTTRLYSTNYWEGGKCKKSNYIGMYGLTMDVDDGLSLEQAKDMFKEYNYIIHTSTSHKADIETKGGIQDRFRIILPADPSKYGKYTDPIQATALYSALIKRYPFIDVACAELARKYFPFLNHAYPQLFECYINDTGKYYEIPDSEILPFVNAKKAGPKKYVPPTNDLADSNFKYIHLDDEVLLKDKTPRRISDFTEQTPIYCPFCDDINSASASGWITFTKKGHPMLLCSHCEQEHSKTGNPQNGKYFLPLNEQYNNILYIEKDLYMIKEGEINVTLGKVPESYLYGLSQDSQKELKLWLAHNRYFTSENFTVERKVDAQSEVLRWKLDAGRGILDINIPPIPVDVKDNEYIDNWLDISFKQYAEFIRDWLAMYCYSNFRPMPLLIINGPRGSGKSTFAEFVAALFNGVSMDWKGDKDQFTEFNEKRLLIIDEANVDKKEQYTTFKALTGQQTLSVNKKYKARYQVRNNLCLILLTNEFNPMYLVAQEKPKTPNDNQFFMYCMEKPENSTINSDIKDELRERAGYYVRTVLKERAEKLFASGIARKCRYTIPTPMTEMMVDSFANAKTSLEYECDLVAMFLHDGYLVKDKMGTIMGQLGPYSIVTMAEIQELINKAGLEHSNAKSFRDRMQQMGFLRRKVLRKGGQDAWEFDHKYYLEYISGK